MLIRFLLIFCSSFAVSLFLVRFLIRLAWKHEFVKSHENFWGRKITIPSLGGLGVYLAFFVSLFFNPSLFQTGLIQGVLIGGALMILIGFFDDRIDFSPLIKIIFQFLVALVLIHFGIKTEIICLSVFANLAITIFWIIVISNALNLLDIMDGLCGGLSFIIALTFFVLALIGKNLPVAVISLGLAGSLMAFLRYNFPPAKIFLGNSGSLFFGCIFSVLAIALDYAPAGRNVALLTPIVIIGLPFYDTFFVIIMRLRRRESVFLKTKDHLAMRFLKRGYSEKGTLFRMYALGIGFTGASILISLSSNLTGLIILGLIIISLGMLTWNMAKVKVE